VRDEIYYCRQAGACSNFCDCVAGQDFGCNLFKSKSNGTGEHAEAVESPINTYGKGFQEGKAKGIEEGKRLIIEQIKAWIEKRDIYDVAWKQKLETLLKEVK